MWGSKSTGSAHHPDHDAEAEKTLRILKPSAKAIVPMMMFYSVLAMSVSVLFMYFYLELTWLMSLLSNLLDSPLLTTPWEAWFLGGVWALCLLQPALYLLQLKTTEYEFTNRRLRYTRGILNRTRDQIELVRVRDLTATRTLLQRLLGLGTLRIESVDRSHPQFDLLAQRSVYELKDWIHGLNVRERARLGYREFEGTQGVG